MLTWALIAFILGLLFWASRKPSNLPPGRWGLPVLGYIPLYTKDITQILDDIRKAYGNIFTWKAGGRVIVGLCDYNVIKKTLARPEFQGRPDLFTSKVFMYHTNTGIINSVDNIWSEGRRFALRHLKDFGMGKSSLEGVVQHEAVELAKSYDKTAGTPVELSWSLNVAVLNVIWKLVADLRYETDDENIMKFNRMLNEDIEVIQGPIGLVNLFPGIEKYLPDFIINKWMKSDFLHKNADLFRDFVTAIIEDHVKTFDPNNLRDYIDAYLAEVQKQKGNSDTIFKEDYLNLVTSIGDLFAAGSETTSSTMRWMVALMAINPKVQRKMQEEIDQVVPRDRAPSLDDRSKLPYTEAVLQEVHRYVSLVPIGVFHETTEDVEVEGYNLPKGTAVFGWTEHCHRNPKYWERPNEFYPEHFLDDQGQFIAKKEGFLPFSLGRRQCLGEALAKMELYMFTTCLFQRFSIAPPEGVTITADTDRTQPLLNFVKPYKVVMTKR